MEPMVQLALRKNDTRIAAKFIQWWTNSKYSHCELIVDGLCYSSSAMDGGVRSKKIELDLNKWDLIPLPKADAEKIISYFKETDHWRYGWLGLILNQFLNLNRETKKCTFCSQWCAAALGLPNSSSLSPDSLGKWALFLNNY